MTSAAAQRRAQPRSELNTTGVRERARAQGTEVKDRGRTRRAGRQVQSGDQPVNSQRSPAIGNRPPGTSGHSTPVTAGAVLNELIERRAWLTR